LTGTKDSTERYVDIDPSFAIKRISQNSKTKQWKKTKDEQDAAKPS
tara:strand:- start:750 stop:887 length:138 start_codon:yes stop_codon:yes gene_type:complete